MSGSLCCLSEAGMLSLLTLTAFAVPAFSTCPCVGFFCELEGRRMPPRDFSSLTSALTSTLSPTGATVLYCGGKSGLSVFKASIDEY